MNLATVLGAASVPSDQHVEENAPPRPADHTERARQVIESWYKYIRDGGNGNKPALVQHFAAALATAERAGAEKTRTAILQYHEKRRDKLWAIATENGIAGAHSAAHGESINAIKALLLPGEK